MLAPFFFKKIVIFLTVLYLFLMKGVEKMDITAIPIEQIVSQGIFCLLFVWLLFDTRSEAKKREEKLTTQIEKQNEAQDRIVHSLERLETQISQLKGVK